MVRGGEYCVRHHKEEKLVVPLSDTRTRPRAMVVHPENAPVADRAMVTAWRLQQIALLAVLVAHQVSEEPLIGKHAVELSIGPVDGLPSLSLHPVFLLPLFVFLNRSVDILQFNALIG